MGNALASLRRFRSSPAAEAVERCDLCGIRLGPEHRHLFETASRKIVCACDACALRFEGVAGGRFVLIPRDVRRLEDFEISDEEWADFSLPIDLAFFFHHSSAGRVLALYPGPAGAVESLLPLDSWNHLAGGHPVLKRMAPDVEALLVDRRRGRTPTYAIAPIDACFRLVGLIRRHWTGLWGGAEAGRKIDDFFQRLGPKEAAHA